MLLSLLLPKNTDLKMAFETKDSGKMFYRVQVLT
jgi:hypothetical protein